MAGISLIAKFLGKDVSLGRTLEKNEKAFKALGERAEKAMNEAGRDTAALDRKIDELENSVAALNREIASTGNTDLLPKVARENRLLNKLRKVRRSLDDVGDEAVQAGAKIGVMMAASTVKSSSGILNKGIKGIFDALPAKAKLAVIGAAVAIGIMFAPAIAAAIVAAVLLAVGGGALVAGIIAAAKNPKVKAAWGEFAKSAKSSLSKFSKPFEGPMIRAAKTFSDMLRRMEPSLKRIGNAVAPLIDKLAPSLVGMIERIMPGLEDAINASLPLFDVLAEHMPAIGDAISNFFTIVSDAGPGAALFLDHFLLIMEKVLPLVGWFFATLAAQYPMAVAVFVGISKGILAVVETWLAGIKVIIDVAAAIPGPHQAAMKKVSAALQRGIDKTHALSRALDDLKKPRTGAISLKTQQAMNKLRALSRKIASVVYDRHMGITVAYRQSGGGTGGRFTERAHGGPVSAGQPYIVGEKRPELFVPETNGRIVPSVPRGSGSGGSDTHVYLHLEGDDDDLLRRIRKNIRTRGGNVQVVLGK